MNTATESSEGYPLRINPLALSVAIACRGLVAAHEVIARRNTFIMLSQRDAILRRMGITPSKAGARVLPS